MESPTLADLIDLETSAFRDAYLSTLGMQPDDKKKYSILDSELFAYDGIRLDYILQTLLRLSNQRKVCVLDFGCGQNVALRELKDKLKRYGLEAELTGVSVGDPRKEDQKSYDERNNIKFIDLASPSATSYDSSKNKYDLIISRLTFLHLPDPLRTLQKLYRALVVGGELRIDLSENELRDMFYPKQGELSIRQDWRQLINYLKAEGFDIEVDYRSLILRKKSKKRLKLPVKYLAIKLDKDWNKRKVIYKLCF